VSVGKCDIEGLGQWGDVEVESLGFLLADVVAVCTTVCEDVNWLSGKGSLENAFAWLTVNGFNVLLVS